MSVFLIGGSDYGERMKLGKWKLLVLSAYNIFLGSHQAIIEIYGLCLV